MSMYTKGQLCIIAQALIDEDFSGAAMDVLWWNSFKGKFSYTIRLIMQMPAKDLPIFINDPNDVVKIIAIERLKL